MKWIAAVSVMAIGASFVRGITISRCLSLCSSDGKRNGVYWSVDRSQMSEVFWAYDSLPYYQGGISGLLISNCQQIEIAVGSFKLHSLCAHQAS